MGWLCWPLSLYSSIPCFFYPISFSNPRLFHLHCFLFTPFAPPPKFFLRFSPAPLFPSHVACSTTLSLSLTMLTTNDCQRRSSHFPLFLFHDGEWNSIVKKRCYHVCTWIKILWYEGYWWIWPQDAWCGQGKNHNSAKLWKNQKKCEIWFQLSRTQTTAGADNRLNGRHMDDPSQRILPKLIGAATSRKRKLKLKGKVAK